MNVINPPLNTPTTIADAIRRLVKTDNDAPRLIVEALQEIPELGLITQKEAQGLLDTLDEQTEELDDIKGKLDTALDKITALEDQLSDRDDEIKDLENQISRLERELGNAEDEIEDLKSELAEAREGGDE
jgi:chromosome segregation ATPase